jgi:hypothetical protein
LRDVHPIEWDEALASLRVRESSSGASVTKEEALMHRDYAWKYFSLHADQRLRTFNFFLAFSTLFLGGFVGLLKDYSEKKWIATLPLLLSILSFVFWKLDVRNRILVSNGESALKLIDESLELADIDQRVHPLKIFARDAEFMKENSFPKRWLVGATLGFSTCFGIVFSIFGYGSFFLALYCLFR